MAHPAPQTVVLRARRETILLVGTTTLLTFALSYAVHSHRIANHPDLSPRQAWAGELAEVSALELASTVTPITSASLVVPKSELALPQAPVRTLVRLHGCDGSVCSTRTTTAPAPPRRPALAETTVIPQASRPATRREKPTLLARLNPLNHLPTTTTLKRPFTVASDTVSGWFKRF